MIKTEQTNIVEARASILRIFRFKAEQTHEVDCHDDVE